MTKAKTRRAAIRPARGALLVITALLVGSAALRFATGAGPALARSFEAIGTSDDMAEHESCAPDPDIAAVLAALADRDASLGDREEVVADREAALALAEELVSKNMAALEAAEERLAATLAIADDAAKEDLDRLTAVYENMKPKEAAALFEEMAPEFAAGFLGRMRPDAAAAVMAGMAPGSAYTVSVILAGRNANAPTE